MFVSLNEGTDEDDNDVDEGNGVPAFVIVIIVLVLIGIVAGVAFYVIKMRKRKALENGNYREQIDEQHNIQNISND